MASECWELHSTRTQAGIFQRNGGKDDWLVANSIANIESVVLGFICRNRRGRGLSSRRRDSGITRCNSLVGADLVVQGILSGFQTAQFIRGYVKAAVLQMFLRQNLSSCAHSSNVPFGEPEAFGNFSGRIELLFRPGCLKRLE